MRVFSLLPNDQRLWLGPRFTRVREHTISSLFLENLLLFLLCNNNCLDYQRLVNAIQSDQLSPVICHCHKFSCSRGILLKPFMLDVTLLTLFY